MNDFTLTELDKNSGLWLRIKSHMEARLAAARIRNDATLPENETATIRGEIKTLKALIRLDVSRPVTGED